MGKTTTAERLAAQLPSGVVFDPEEVGFLLRRCVPVPTGDFQDLRAWRHLVAETIIAILREHRDRDVAVVVAMSVTNGRYRSEIFRALRGAGVALHEFVLTARREELERRITEQVLYPDDPSRDQSARQWRLARLDAGNAALLTPQPTPRTVDTTSMSPGEVVATITEALAARPG